MNSREEDQDDFVFHAPDAQGQGSSDRIFKAYLQARRELAEVPRASRISLEDSLHTILREKLRADERGLRLFRKTNNANDTLANFWLAKVSAAANFAQAWRKPPQFNKIDKSFLNEFARLSIDPHNINSVEDRLASVGIIMIHERAIPGMKVDGACFLLASGRPVVALSLRYSRLDIYWFVLMHELAHVVAHYQKLTEPILDDFDEELQSDIEIEANALAANSLIPRNIWRSANVHYNSSEAELMALAHAAKTHPAIVAGRIQRETHRHYIFANFVNSANTREIVFGHD